MPRASSSTTLAALDLSQALQSTPTLARLAASKSSHCCSDGDAHDSDSTSGTCATTMTTTARHQHQRTRPPSALATTTATQSLATPRDDERNVLCRMCERRVPSFALALHTQHCAAAQRLRASTRHATANARRLLASLPATSALHSALNDALCVQLERSRAARSLARIASQCDLAASNVGDVTRQQLKRVRAVFVALRDLATQFAALPVRYVYIYIYVYLKQCLINNIFFKKNAFSIL